MIYIFENYDGNASVVYDQNALSEEEKLLSIQVAELPLADRSKGLPVLKCNKESGNVWWEYVPREKTNEEMQAEIDTLKLMVADLGLMVGGGL